MGSRLIKDDLKTLVYIDGFNLYYAVRKTPYKWLDLDALCRALLPRNRIDKIKYFTARVSGRPHDPNQPARQETYLRALRTIPTIEIFYGRFLTKDVLMPLTSSIKANPARKPRMVRVRKTEEKGSDVNLAVHLLSDAYKKEFEVAVLVTNDSDLSGAIRIVRQELGLTVGIINPGHRHQSAELAKQADFIRMIRIKTLKNCQLPLIMEDAKGGQIEKPSNW